MPTKLILLIACSFLSDSTGLAFQGDARKKDESTLDQYAKIFDDRKKEISAAIEILDARGGGELDRSTWFSFARPSGHYINEKIQLREHGPGTKCLKLDAKIYEFFLNEHTLAELKLSDSVKDEIVAIAKDLSENWQKRYRDYSQNKSFVPLVEHLRQLVEFYNALESRLSEKQREVLAWQFFRRNFLTGVGPQNNRRLSQWMFVIARYNQVPLNVRRECEKRILEKTNELKSAGNKLLIREVERLLPGYLDSVKDVEAEAMPLLPLAHLIAVIDHPEKLKTKNSGIFKELQQTKVTDGKLIFPGALFELSNAAEIKFSNYQAMLRYKPKSPFEMIYTITNSDLVGQQNLEYWGIFKEIHKASLKNATIQGAEEAYVPEGMDVKNQQHLNK